MNKEQHEKARALRHYTGMAKEAISPMPRQYTTPQWRAGVDLRRDGWAFEWIDADGDLHLSRETPAGREWRFVQPNGEVMV